MQIEAVHTLLVIGAGTMGTQIALQCAMHGYSVNLYDNQPAALDQSVLTLRKYADQLTSQGLLSPAQAREALERIHATFDPQAAAQADLVSESVPEDPQVKAEVFAAFNQLCPAETIFTTNTSSLSPSLFAEATGRPDRFAALHFHGYVWVSNVVDIMPAAGTAAATLDLLEAFARRIGQIPIRLEKESNGYVFNAMLNGMLRAATTLVAQKVTSFQNVDRAWMGVMKTPIGPFGILDQVGLETAWHINQYWADVQHDAELQTNANLLKTYVDQGWLGVKTGRGFYTYPDPEFTQPGFISNPDHG